MNRLIFVIFLICPTLLFAEEPGVRIVELEIEGLERTKLHVVERELLVEEGERTTIEEIEESVQRLRNMPIFDTVEYELEDVADDAARLRIGAAERWTILPILQFSFGGDVTRAELGVYDLNVLGRFFELGGEYRYVAGAHSFGLWYREPRFLGERILLEVEGWRGREVFIRYDLEQDVEGGFMLERDFGMFLLEPELSPRIRTMMGARFGRTSFSLGGVPEDARDAQDPAALPDLSWVGSIMAGGRLGRIDEIGYRQTGQEISANLELVRSLGGAEVGHVEPSLRLLFFRALPWKSNVGVRLEWKATTAANFAYHHYVGGLDEIRGYRNSRFNGRTFWNANAEFRIPSLDHRLLVIQHVALVDGLGIADDFAGLATVTGASAGIGVRLIVPPVYGLILRFDLAYPVGAPGDAYFNAGSLQFF
ncbi:MAG: POTRA domain-containing protein [Bradymonadaceae bacterium]